MRAEAGSVVAPFRLPALTCKPLPGGVAAAARGWVERLLGLRSLNALYADALSARNEEASFCERALRVLGIRIELSDDDRARIPPRGPLIVVSNHPFGALDGLVLLALLQRVRPDVRLLANYLLGCIPEMHAACFFADPFAGPAAQPRNRSAARAALRWVRGGGALGVFPAGEVSHLVLRKGCVTDPPWNVSMARLAADTRAAVLPVYIEGRNRRRFQIAGLLHPRLRTAMLPRELLSQRGRTIHVQIGSVIPHRRIAALRDAGRNCGAGRDPSAWARTTEYLRLRTYILKGRRSGHPEVIPRRVVDRRAALPLAEPVPSETLAAEVGRLPAAQELAGSGAFRVYYGRAVQIPCVLREIGRLRELAFRQVGEGTGRAVDLDRFDEHYLHLFAWDEVRQGIAGAYRIGRSDELLARFGPAGLYTSTLFDFAPRLLDQISSALELGRSFVSPAYQRDYAPLMLLWKGIGRYVVDHPQYRRLFGAVSISDEYHSMTRQLLMAFLSAQHMDSALASLVRPKHPPQGLRGARARNPFPDVDLRRLATWVCDLSEVEELVGEIESSRRGIPVLLRQYLKLNARLLGFNIDPEFGNVLDGLVLVDLANVERVILDRYLGQQGAARFLGEKKEHSKPGGCAGKPCFGQVSITSAANAAPGGR